MLMLWTSCSSDDEDMQDDDGVSVADIEAALYSGDWIITYYYDSETDESSNYLGFDFTFNANGTLGATDGNTSVSGAWSITDSNSDDDSIEDIDFNIFFSSPDIFEELSDDWDLKSFTSTKIELIDVSSGNSTTDYLTFERN